MHIIIDGYNLIRQSVALRRYERYSLEEGRKALIRYAALYKRRKGHKVTVVFDGWEGGPAEEERDRQEGINVVYSRRGEKADDVIKRMVQHTGEECVVITSDRDVADFVSRRRGTAVSSQEFEAIIERLNEPLSDAQLRSDEIYEKDYDAVREGVKRKGPSRRLSRRKKAAMVTLRKL